jgi:hypothetical protein
MPTIRNFLDLSTAHLSEATRDMLDEADFRDGGFCPGGRMSYGWFLYADESSKQDGSWYPNEETRGEDMPADLWRCMAYARAHNCDYVLFDADAPIDPNLPTYEEGEEVETPPPMFVRALKGPGKLADHADRIHDFGQSGAVGRVIAIDQSNARSVAFLFPDRKGSAGVASYSAAEVFAGEIEPLAPGDEHPMFTRLAHSLQSASPKPYWEWVDDMCNAWATYETPAEKKARKKAEKEQEEADRVREMNEETERFPEGCTVRFKIPLAGEDHMGREHDLEPGAIGEVERIEWFGGSQGKAYMVTVPVSDWDGDPAELPEGDDGKCAICVTIDRSDGDIDEVMERVDEPETRGE